MSAPTATTSNFETIDIGSDTSAITVSILKFPRADGALLDKVQAFSYFDDVINQHRAQLTSTAIQQAYSQHVPVSCSAAASEEANRLGALAYSAFFDVTNLACLGFYTASGQPATVAPAPCDRDPSILFVHFEARVNPRTLSADLSSLPITTATFYLKLPQSETPPAASPPTPTVAAAALAASIAAAKDQIAAALNAGTELANIDTTGPIRTAALASLISPPTLGQTTPAAYSTPVPVRLFPATTPASFASVSPGLRRFLVNGPTPSAFTFCGALDFLNTQAAFDATFPPLDRKPLGARSITASASNPAAKLISLFAADCRLVIFQTVLRLDYIGHHDFTSADHLLMTVKRLRQLSLNYHYQGRLTFGSPDHLFSKYIALTPLLPASHVNIWGINLFSSFWDALGDDLTRRITRLPSYTNLRSSTFDLTTMTTKTSQMHALRELRSLASDCFATMQDDRKALRSMVLECTSGSRHKSSSHTSAAETTMQQYSPPPNLGMPTSLPARSPPNPSSRPLAACEFPADFRGCLGCGGADHVFRVCPQRTDPAITERFHRNFNARFGRLRPATTSPGTHTFQVPPGQPPSSTHGGGGRGGAIRNMPSWMTKQHVTTPASSYGPATSSPSASTKPPSDVNARQYPMMVRSFQQLAHIDPPRRPMPIRVDNGLPHIRISLGPLDGNISLSALFDSGAALSSGYLPYHLWIMRENPEIVASFERFDDENPFEPIKLGGAISHPSDYTESVHGQLTAVIRYKTAYVCHDGAPIHLSFGLGNDMTVNTILGLPTICDLGMKPDFRRALVTCDDTPAVFSLLSHATRCGIDTNIPGAAASFADLPVAQMYPLPSLASSTTYAEPCVQAVDDTSQGFLQRRIL
jgi:hypothetical protein